MCSKFFFFFLVNFLVSPSGAASIFPENVTLNSASSVAQIQVTANIPSSNIIITPVLSGPGAVYYSSTPGQDPNPFYFASTKSIYHYSIAIASIF